MKVLPKQYKVNYNLEILIFIKMKINYFITKFIYLFGHIFEYNYFVYILKSN